MADYRIPDYPVRIIQGIRSTEIKSGNKQADGIGHDIIIGRHFHVLVRSYTVADPEMGHDRLDRGEKVVLSDRIRAACFSRKLVYDNVRCSDKIHQSRRENKHRDYHQ